MKKFLQKLSLPGLLLITGLVGSNLRSLAQDCIYFVNFNGGYPSAPSIENESYFQKLNETSEGSGVFSGDIDISSIWGGSNTFRFYRELQPCSTSDPEFSWNKGNIGPFKSNDYLQEIGKSGIYFADDVTYKKNSSPYEEAQVWWLDKNGVFNVTVDLNNHTMTLIPQDEVFVLVNDSQTPALEAENLSNYSSLSNFKKYFSPGDLNIAFYSPYFKQWCQPFNITFSRGTNRVFKDIIPVNEYSPIKVKWPGGTMEGWKATYDYYLIANPDGAIKPDDLSAEQIYLIGGFCNWSFYDSPVFEKANEEGTIFNVTFPATDELEFKFTNQPDWDGFNLGSSGVIATDSVGNFVINLESNFNNIKFNSPITSPLNGVLDLEKFTLTLPPNAPLTATPVIDYKDALFLNLSSNPYELWSDAPASVVSHFPVLYKDSVNSWSTTVNIPAGDLNFNFISELSSNAADNKYIVPSNVKNRKLEFVDWYAYSTAVETAGTQNAYWSYSDWNGGNVTFKLTKTDEGYVLLVDADGKLNNKIYLVGQPQGWDITSDAMPLYLTDKGGYYASYEIPAGYAMFRFYSELGDWDSNSIGSVAYDYPEDVEMENGRLQWNSVYGGKGSWNFENWPGGIMYLYVSGDFSYVIFSDSPIEEAGEILTEIKRDQTKDGVFIFNNNKYGSSKESMVEIGDGIYSYSSYYSNTDELKEVKFFTKQLPISSEEPEWAESFTLIPDLTDFDLAKSSYFETTLKRNDKISKEPTAGLNITNISSYTMELNFIVDLNEDKLYIANTTGGFVLPSAKYSTTPSANEYLEVDKYRTQPGGSIIDIPANEFDVWMTRYTSVRPSEEAIVSFEDGPMQVETTDPNFGWAPKRLVSPNWKGGKVFVSPIMAYDLSELKSIKAHTNNKTVEISQTAPGSLVFHGEIEISKPDQTYGLNLPSLSFEIDRLEKEVNYWGQSYLQTFVISLGSSAIMSGVGYYPTLEERSLYLDGGKAESKIEFNSYNFVLPNIVEGTFDVTVDLNDMTVKLEQIKGISVNVYETIADEESGIDGLKSYIDMESENPCLEASDLAGKADGYDFNLMGKNGAILVPENNSDTQIEFNENGVWEGKYVETTSVATYRMLAERSSLRTLASSQGQWHFDLPENVNTDLQIMIDENAKTMKIFSSGHNNHFFLVSSDMEGIMNYPSISTLTEDVPLLKEDGNGIYTGVVEIPDNAERVSLLFAKSLPSATQGCKGLAYDFYGPNGDLLDLTMDQETVKSAWHTFNTAGYDNTYSAMIWTLLGEPYQYNIAYNSNDNTLTVSKSAPLKVNEITPDNLSDVKVIPGVGEVTIICNDNRIVSIYNTAGMLIKTVRTVAGNTKVELPAGLYIINRQKVMVK